MMNHDLFDTGDVKEAAALLHWALQRKERPAHHPAYQQLLRRYLSLPSFRALVESMVQGLQMVMLSADEYGMILVPASQESVFALTPPEHREIGGQDNRLLEFLIQVAIVTTFYPLPHTLEGDINIVQSERSVADVEQTLRTMCQTLEDNAHDQSDPTVEDIQLRLLDTWRVYQRKAADKRTYRGHRSVSSTTSMIQRAFEKLRAHDCVMQTSRGYRPTRRFQIHVQQWSASRYYQSIQALLLKREERE